jgi:5-methyltetrahydrofolate--homocysteine methyltransferase
LIYNNKTNNNHRQINQAQLEDYAKRKGVSIEQAERLLSPNLE